QHAPDLLLEHGRLMQLSSNGRSQKVVVRNAAPQEERQPRCQINVAEFEDGPSRRIRRLPLDTKEKVRRCKDTLEAALNTGIESSIRSTFFVEIQQRLCLRFRDRTPISPASQCREYLPCTSLFRRRSRGPAAENPAAARRVVIHADGVKRT